MFGFEYAQEDDYQQKRAERLQRENDSLRQKLHNSERIAKAREWFPDDYVVVDAKDGMIYFNCEDREFKMGISYALQLTYRIAKAVSKAGLLNSTHYVEIVRKSVGM